MSEFLSLLIAFIPADKRTFWELINSQVLSTIVAAIVAILVAKYGGAAASNAATNQEVISATNEALKLEEDENPAPIDAPEIAGARDFRGESVPMIQDAKRFLDGRAIDDPDGRHKRTYIAIPRHDYLVLAVALKDRGRIEQEQLNAASNLFSLWKIYDKRNGKKTVPEAAFFLLKSAHDNLVGSTKRKQKRS
jgi:hypothetical protein